MNSFAKTAGLVWVCCIIHLAGALTSADAALITVNFVGTVDSVDGPLAGTFSVGQTLTGSYTFESTTAPRAGSDSSFAVCDALTALNFAIGSYSASSSSALEIQVDNAPGAPNDRYGIASRASDGLTGPAVAGNSLGAFLFRLDDSTNAVFSNALVLPTNPSLSDFDSNRFFVFFDDANPDTGPFIVSGTFSSLSTRAVPEPSSLSLLGLGTLGLLGYVRSRRKQRR